LNQYTTWWREIIDFHVQKGATHLTITPEFGPYPYLPQAPFSQAPLADQHALNLQMKQYLEQNLLVK
jgi:hypothetical protein